MTKRTAIQAHVIWRLRGLRLWDAALGAVGSNCCGPVDVALPLAELLVDVPVSDVPGEVPPAVLASTEGDIGLCTIDDVATGLTIGEANGEADVVAGVTEVPTELATVLTNDAADAAGDTAVLADETAELVKGAAMLVACVAEVLTEAGEVVTTACAVPLAEAESIAPPTMLMKVQISRNCLNCGSILVKPDVEALCFLLMQV